MSNELPYDLEELFGGAVRAMFAPLSQAVPSKLSDIFDLSDPYAVNGSWENLGATTGPATYGRNLTTSGFNIQQESTTVLEVPNETVRTIAVPLAEIRPDILAMIEESGSVGATTDGVGDSIQDVVSVGSITDLTQYRVAFVGRRLKAQGVVLEGAGGKERGRFLGFAGYRAQLSADNVQMSFGRGELAAATVTFRLFPEPTITDEGEEYGIWFSERAGTIALA